jgi:hypothetical protein
VKPCRRSATSSELDEPQPIFFSMSIYFRVSF